MTTLRIAAGTTIGAALSVTLVSAVKMNPWTDGSVLEEKKKREINKM